MLQEQTTATISEINESNNAGKQVRIAGVISHLRTLTTRKGDPMAFATLEDLDDKIDLVLFPKTWLQVREHVKIDQVVLVIGTVQVKDDQANLIVDKVSTKLQAASAADDGLAEARLVTRSPEPAPQPAFKKETAPQREPAAAGPVLETTGQNTPPPPPNFDENWGPVSASPTKEVEAPVQELKREVAPAQLQNAAPEPVIEKIEEPALLQASKKEPVQEFAQEQQVVTQGGKMVAVPAHVKSKAQFMVVEIGAVGNWREACRRSLDTARMHPGEDALRLHIAGQDLTMEFPDCGTKVCDDLVNALERIPGIVRVYKS
jgi:DNA polymerase-3 subunit alpha